MLGTASKLQTARKVTLSGAVSGNANFDGSGNITIQTTQANVAILTGSVTLTNDIESNITINYPTGFNNTNSVLMACGLGRQANNYSFGQRKQNTSATMSGLPINNVNLNASNIKLSLKFDFNTDADIIIYYKIVLMKI